ncbi:hypothetical protein BKA70DRAFT_1231973 [Coprinopsis sp. MPI-PUGE-AT-0042]|nr:hypothetical protein BKA70DRAFT_1231973 [Coprinopsis sp. MPI-PUGE-AT-0042]
MVLNLPPNVANVYIYGGSDILLLPLCMASPTELTNARFLLDELVQPPSSHDLLRRAKQWTKETWFTEGGERYCRRDIYTGEPERENWSGRSDVIGSYRHIHSLYSQSRSNFKEHIYPQIVAILERGGPMQEVWSSIIQLRYQHGIGSKILPTQISLEGLILNLDYFVVSRVVVTAGDEASDTAVEQLLDNIYISRRAEPHLYTPALMCFPHPHPCPSTPIPTAEVRAENETLQIAEQLRKPLKSDLPFFAKEWVKQTWYSNGRDRFCTRNPFTGSPDRDAWVRKEVVLRSYQEVLDAFVQKWEAFESNVEPVLLAAMREGGSFHSILWKLNDIRAEGCIPTRIPRLVDGDGRIIEFEYEFEGRDVESEGDAQSDQLLEIMITRLQARLEAQGR